MKNVCLSLVFGIVFSMPLFSLANANRITLTPDYSLASLFQLDEAAVYESVSPLIELELYLEDRLGLSLGQLQAEKNPLVQDMQFSNVPDLHLSEPPLGIPSFIWGFCLGIIGLAVVYFLPRIQMKPKKRFLAV